MAVSGNVNDESRNSKLKDVRGKNPMDFHHSRAEEKRGLIDIKTFQLVNPDELAAETSIFGSRFVDIINNAYTGIRCKRQLMAQNFQDTNYSTIVIKTFNVQRFRQRILLSLAVAHENLNCHIRDMTQAYNPSFTSLEREVYIQPLV